MAFSFAPGKDLFFHQVSPLPWCAWINITSFTYISGLSWENTANINYLWFEMGLILVTAQKNTTFHALCILQVTETKTSSLLKDYFTITIKPIGLFLPLPTTLLYSTVFLYVATTLTLKLHWKGILMRTSFSSAQGQVPYHLADPGVCDKSD